MRNTTSCNLRFLKLGIFTFCSKQTSSVELKKYLYFWVENNTSEKQELLAHWFPVRIELVLEGILPAFYVFQGGDTLSVFLKAYTTELQKEMYLSNRTILSQKQEHLPHWSPVRMAQFLKGMLPATQDFPRGHRPTDLN